MNFIYAVTVTDATGRPFSQTILSVNKDGKSAALRAQEAVLAAAGTGTWVLQSANLMRIDQDLTG